MKRFLILLSLAIFSSGHAAAQTNKASKDILSDAGPSFLSGIYSGYMTGLQMVVVDAEKGLVGASASVHFRSCGGSITGMGIFDKPGVLTITPSDLDEHGKDTGCRLTATFYKNPTRVSLKESEHCTTFHGASCGWEGGEQARKLRINYRVFDR